VDDPLGDKARLEHCVARVKISFEMKKIERSLARIGNWIAQGDGKLETFRSAEVEASGEWGRMRM
jgi:hypothetical protein